MYLPIIKPIARTGLRILSIVLFILTIAAAYGGRVNPEYLPYCSWLTLALPYFAIATMIVTVIWFGYGKIFTGALGVIALILSWGPISTSVPIHFPSKPVDENRTFKLLTYNILHGVDQTQNQTDSLGLLQEGNPTIEYIINSGADIVNMQEFADLNDYEIPNLSQYMDTIRKIYPYRIEEWVTDRKVFSKFPISAIKFDKWYDIYKVHTTWGNLTLINMHLPSYSLTDDERQVVKEIVSVKKTEDGLRELKGSIREKLNESFKIRAGIARELKEDIEQIKGPLIVAGDFNDVPESYAYRTVVSSGLADAYSQTSFGPLITYNQHGFLFHLDQIFYRQDPLKALKVTKGTLKCSDHYPLMAEFEWLPAATTGAKE